MDLDLTFPAVSDLRSKAKKRLPKFAFEYLDSATGRELGAKRNREAWDSITFMPQILQGEFSFDLSTRFMGQDFDLPVGIAPIGMSGMIWPGAEKILATTAARNRIPYSISSVAAATPEEIGPHTDGLGWFQLYPPADPEIRRDMLKRIKEAGFTKLIVTVDVPGESRRERQRRALISMPPKMRPAIIWSMVTHPHWSLAMAKEGSPRMKFPESYVDASGSDAFVHAGRVLRGWPDWDYLSNLRDEWQGDILVKGVMVPEDAKRLVSMGIDGIWVSNHSARQFEAAPSTIEQLPLVREAVGKDIPIVVDSGISGGLDIMRGLALGADFVFLGRAFHYAVAALGEQGGDHLVHILRADLCANMSQIGAHSLRDLPSRIHHKGVCASNPITS